MSDQVIFVDDEATIREAVQQWLELSGFEVRLCLRAEECLGTLDKSFAGVVISDVRMPGMDGLQLLANLQAVDRDLPVIMVTGHGDVPMAVEAMRQGAYDFIEKPFTPERLLDLHPFGADSRQQQLLRLFDHVTQLDTLAQAAGALAREGLQVAGERGHAFEHPT